MSIRNSKYKGAVIGAIVGLLLSMSTCCEIGLAHAPVKRPTLGLSNFMANIQQTGTTLLIYSLIGFSLVDKKIHRKEEKGARRLIKIVIQSVMLYFILFAVIKLLLTLVAWYSYRQRGISIIIW